jgi:hypothetical protein
MPTADTITNEQIRELRDAAYREGNDEIVGFCHAALGVYDPLHALTFRSREDGRARCAEIIEARDAREWEHDRQPEQRVKRNK